MKLDSVTLENFRSFENATIQTNDYTCFVGSNGSGKSNILTALNVFFNESISSGDQYASLHEEDFHHKDTNTPIKITLVFKDLTEEAKSDFAHYVRQDKLIVSAIATFEPQAGRATVRQCGFRLAMKDFSRWFAASEKEKVEQLRNIYEEIRKTYPDLPKENTKPKMEEALQTFESEHADLCELLESKHDFYGVSKGRNLLEKYIQWVYVPAVKDARDEQRESKDTALGQLLDRTVRAKTNFDTEIGALRQDTQQKYQDLLNQSQGILQSVSDSLTMRLKQLSHPDTAVSLEWGQDEKTIRLDGPAAQVSIRENIFSGELKRFGHGLQRSYLLALLQELATSDLESGPTLLLGCEEPELYQHPPQARHLNSVFESLSKQNTQIIASTHSPYFVSAGRFEGIRRFQNDGACSLVFQATKDSVSALIANAKAEQPINDPARVAKIHQCLQVQLSEMFFTKRLLLVEGPEDVAYLMTYLHLLDKYDDYREEGCHIVPANGKDSLLGYAANPLYFPPSDAAVLT